MWFERREWENRLARLGRSFANYLGWRSYPSIHLICPVCQTLVKFMIRRANFSGLRRSTEVPPVRCASQDYFRRSLMQKEGCALFHTTKCFKGDLDYVLQSGPWPWRDLGPKQKPQEKISTSCTHNAGRQNQRDFGYNGELSKRSNHGLSGWRMLKKVFLQAPSSTPYPYKVDLLWNPNWACVVQSLQGLLARTTQKLCLGSTWTRGERGCLNQTTSATSLPKKNTVCLCSLSASRHLHYFIPMISRTWLAAKFQNADVRSWRSDERVDLLWHGCTSENAAVDLSPRSA